MKFASRFDLGILGEPDSPELWQEIINEIDIRPNMRFLSVACGHGTEAKVLARALVNSGHYTKKQAIDAIYLIDKYQMFTEHAKFIGFKNVITDDFLKWKPKMKFDAVLANPPYVGKKCLHQQFFNKAVEDMVVEGGQVCFIQPATVYVNNKPNQKNAVIDMQNHILNNTTKVIMKESTVFENANVATDLSITILTKDGSQSGVIDSLTYLNGSTYANSKFNEVNACMMDHEIYASLWQKIFAQIGRLGSLQDKIITSGQMFRITKVRGNMNCDDFYTFISRDKKYWVGESNHGLEVNSERHIENIASYFKTYLARFALSLYKFNTAMVNGELKSVPLVDFSQEWSDEKLIAEWGITEEEYAEVLKVIPAYYD